MYEEINEGVDVVVLFCNGRVIPHSFQWRGRKYLVEKVNLEHEERRGKEILFCFSVSSGGNSYELTFDNLHLVWTLEKIWTE